MSKISISTQDTRAKVSDIRDQAAQYNSLQLELFNEGREIDAMWEGDASDTFANRLRADEPRFGELFQIVTQYCDTIDESANKYDRTEQAIAEEMRDNTKRQSN